VNIPMIALIDYMAKRGKKTRVGRPSREDLGLPKKINVGTSITEDLYNEILKKHGTLINALKFAASAKG